MASLAEPPGAETDRVAGLLELRGRAEAAEYTDVFGLQLWPYASIYVGAEGKLGGEARDRVAGFWRALHLTPPAEVDHLAALLGLYATLAESEEAEQEPARRRLRHNSRRALLWEHLLSWLPLYLSKLQEIGSPFYIAWAGLLREALIAEARRLGPPDQLPIHLRDAPPLCDPRADGADAFLAGLVAPVRTGMLLARDDLRRAARELGLGLRQGERLYVLKALLSQEPAAALGWLADEAGRWESIHGSMPEELEPVRGYWRGRARAGAQLIASLRPIVA
ncbi:MAG TPA: molecular chaperone TorD family protein [Candidatus Dormibacteraeota bacterium]